MFLKISQNSQESIRVRVFFFNNVAALRPAILLKRRLWDWCFLVNLWNFQEHLFCRSLPGDCFCWFWFFMIIVQGGFLFTYSLWISWTQIKCNEICIELCFMKQSERNTWQCIFTFKTLPTSKEKQKQKWYWRTKNVYLKRSNFSYMGSCDENFYAEIRSRFFHN